MKFRIPAYPFLHLEELLRIPYYLVTIALFEVVFALRRRWLLDLYANSYRIMGRTSWWQRLLLNTGATRLPAASTGPQSWRGEDVAEGLLPPFGATTAGQLWGDRKSVV